MSDRTVSETRTIHAAPERIFELLTDPAKHSTFDGSGQVISARGGEQKLRLGSEFGMDMKRGLSYRITNKVVEYEENRLIAWRHAGRHRWRWELRPVDAKTTEVTETFDYSMALGKYVYPLVGIPGDNRKAIVRSLDRLEELFPAIG